MMLFSRTVLLAAVFALATFAVGWWSLPLVAVLYTVIAAGGTGLADRSSAVVAGMAAMVGWAALLAIASARGPVPTLAAELAGILRLPTAGIYAVTIAYPGLLAISAAIVARVLTGRSR
jgi:hypothetical protein